MMATAFLGYKYSLTWMNITYDTPTYNLAWTVITITCSPRLQAILAKHEITPKATFENLHLAKQPGTKAQLYEGLKPLAGVYIIVNLTNGKTYVGSGIKARMHLRLHKHLFKGQGSKTVWAAVIKYGLANFAFVVADTLPGVSLENNRKLL